MRPDLDLYFMRMARLAATRSTCLRKAVGCVLVDDRGHVLATGYNGVARGQAHCNEARQWMLVGGGSETRYDNACPGAMEKGGGLELCAAVHAEQNATLQCADPEKIKTIYCTLAPCDPCLKLFLNTGAERLVVGEWWRDNRDSIYKRWEPRILDFEARE